VWQGSDVSPCASENTRKGVNDVRINAFPAAKQGYVKDIWAPLLTMNTFPGAGHASSVDRELQLLRERWSGEVVTRQKGQHRDGVTIETVDFTFSPSAAGKKKRPSLSWHLRMEEPTEIENAWNGIRTGEQVQKVLAHLGLFPVCLKPARRTVWLNGRSNLTNPGFYHEVAARAWSQYWRE